MSRQSPIPAGRAAIADDDDPVIPRRLDLSLNPEDGSLLTAPLLSVLMAVTDSLYSDLYHMAQGEVDVTSSLPVTGADDPEESEDQPQQPQASSLKKERMSNLSFAQRRHELSWRLMSHGKSLTHVAALTAAAASADLATATQVSTKALQHARTAWVQADEAQDALFFFHAQLFPARQAPHDVYGALDLLLRGSWPDMPQDLQLLVDRYENSQEKSWPSMETADRWHMAVREKLLLGEMGWMKQKGIQVPWKISLRGGVVRLTHGTPKAIVVDGERKKTYPMEAVLTVLDSTSTPANWTLVSVEVHAQAKTGQSNHQLDTSNRQRFDIHRLCALSMAREEARNRKEGGEGKEQQPQQQPPARPLHALFQVAHTFCLSWQLEILSAQAQALRKGVWGSSSSSIVVTPAQFFQNRSLLGIVSISFWSIDDRYGPPCMGDLHVEDEEEDSSTNKESSGTKQSSSDSVSTVSRSINEPSVTNQLTLSVRAEANVGIRVALSGADTIMEFASAQPHTREAIQQLLNATSNPFCLSASEALLAATHLCAERKCQAMVNVLPDFLPHWIHLSLDRASIVVAASIEYDGIVQSEKRGPVVLFRLTCDARTGSFIPTFSRSTQLLQFMACNDPKAASESATLRIATLANHRRASRAVGASMATGRSVRDVFQGLVRSINVLGQRTGVGGSWKDKDDMSSSLRLRAVQTACKDVKVSLQNCCGMAAMYGLAALSFGVATGVSAIPDMAGGCLEPNRGNGKKFLLAPPLSLLIDQHMIETTQRTSDGDKTQKIYTEQELFGTCCAVDDSALTVYGLKINTRLDTPSSVPNRTSWELKRFHQSGPQLIPMEVEDVRPMKRARMTESSNGGLVAHDMTKEVEYFASVLSDTLEMER
ncbi:unnamed protein product [Cylindrotheca closterium]|uniref:Uncharacterized protein n=1 Tax=Cylindrotheca closterium TaxID=2856 RepID=A0AAD2G7R5_9STRA|nr:unnamed protein product [Cylindrotheca closterium]